MVKSEIDLFNEYFRLKELPIHKLIELKTLAIKTKRYNALRLINLALENKKRDVYIS